MVFINKYITLTQNLYRVDYRTEKGILRTSLDVILVSDLGPQYVLSALTGSKATNAGEKGCGEELISERDFEAFLVVLIPAFRREA
jgi:hypothetical protein